MQRRERALHSLLFVATILTFLTPSGSAQSKSSLTIPIPTETGRVPAVTYDTAGERVGTSEFALLEQPQGHILLRVVMRVDGGGSSEVEAEFEPTEAGGDGRPLLRLLSQRSQSYEPDGSPMTLLHIDHVTREASCTAPGGAPDAREVIPLPEDDRVANVPMHLLFLPIVRGEVDRIHFQLFVCRGGARLHDFVALRAKRQKERDGRAIVEVRYGPDLGKVMSWVASRVLPKLSFWFDSAANGAYVAHRMPIHSEGQDILVIREGISPEAVGAPF
jgi:hypothetical protein